MCFDIVIISVLQTINMSDCCGHECQSWAVHDVAPAADLSGQEVITQLFIIIYLTVFS